MFNPTIFRDPTEKGIEDFENIAWNIIEYVEKNTKDMQLAKQLEYDLDVNTTVGSGLSESSLPEKSTPALSDLSISTIDDADEDPDLSDEDLENSPEKGVSKTNKGGNIDPPTWTALSKGSLCAIFDPNFPDGVKSRSHLTNTCAGNVLYYNTLVYCKSKSM